MKKLEHHIKDSIVEAKHKIILNLNQTKSGKKHSHHAELDVSEKIHHSYDANILVEVLGSAKKIIQKIFLPKTHLKNITKNELVRPKKELVQTKKSHHSTNDIFLPTSFLSNIDYMRVPFVGAALKFFAEMHNDIHEYGYKDGKHGRLPDFCGNQCCPAYQINCKNDLYEVRQYGDLTFIEYTVNGSDYLDNGLRTGFSHIFNYFNGENDQNAKIHFTVPVLIKGSPNPSTSTQTVELISNAGPTISLMLPPPFAIDPPKPTCPQFKIVQHSNPLCYVRMFGGYPLPATFISKTNEFIKILQLNNQFITHKPIAAFYDKPSQFVNRHNEIIIPIDNPSPGDVYC
ncbi:uncharacterized protein LOC135923900 [Gordionus sp. m RMFG-2023]|uniref:uncharacterized protein LOC135923900 n=1 Tax=Gordionus sp. m RMFG-2023 TaxID=3053472 RepID=UPI0031FC9A4C